MNELQITKKQENYINKYHKAVARCEKSMWGLAKVVYDTVNNEDFKEVFGNYENYAKAVGVSKVA